MITTKQPTDDMIEVAIVSMEQALVADGETIPDGSAAFEREPLADAEARIKAERDTEHDGRRAGAGATTAGSPTGVAAEPPIPVETERPAPGA